MAEIFETVSQVNPVDKILADYRDAVDAGKNPDRQALLERYPEHRQELEKRFAEEDRVEEMVKPLQTGGPAPIMPDLAAFGELEEVGQGGIGVVYRGRDPQLPRDLAIKVLRPDRQDQPELVRRFIEEAKITGKLQHPGVVPVHALGQMPDGRPYFTMKLIQGRTLSALLAERASPSQDLPRFLKIFEQVCQTLAYTHSQEIIHRDLKPANIMVGAFAEVQVMDWGFAKVLRTPQKERPGTADNDSLTADALEKKSRAGQVMGTLPYMPPEQARGEVDRLDERCDVFSLGAILCEILTGRPAYQGTQQEVFAKAQRGDLADAWHRLDECEADAEVIAIARRCLSPSPDERPRNAGEVAEAIATYQAGVQERLRAAELARAAAQAKAGEERKRRRLTKFLAAAVVLIVLGSSGAALWYFDDQARQEREVLLRQTEIARKKALAEQEIARKKALAEQDVRQNLKQAEEGHGKLLLELMTPGGIQGLLNQRPRWERQIKTARATWQRAKDRVDNAEGNLDRELTNLLGNLDDNLAHHQRDYDLAWRLERIHLDAATIVDGKFNHALAEREYPRAFAEAGMPTDFIHYVHALKSAVRFKVNIGLFRESVIKEQLLAALDHWALLNPKYVGQFLGSRILGEAFFWDSLPSPFSLADQARKLAETGDPVAIKKLADGLERGSLVLRSPSICIFLSANLHDQWKQESLLRKGRSDHPGDFWCNFELANFLREKKPAEAIGYYYVALAIRPESSAVYCNLGQALRDRGEFAAGLKALQKGHELGQRQPGWPFPSAAWVKHCQQLVTLDRKLAPVLNGVPVDSGDLLALADLCRRYKKRYGDSAALFAKAFAAEPKAAENSDKGYRYHAACAAALAAAGKGADADKLDAKEKSRLRQEALKWLQADLAAYSMRLGSGKQEDRTLVGQRLGDWMVNRDLAGIRDAPAVTKLPPEEQETFRKLWAEVEALRKKAEASETAIPGI